MVGHAGDHLFEGEEACPDDGVLHVVVMVLSVDMGDTCMKLLCDCRSLADFNQDSHPLQKLVHVMVLLHELLDFPGSRLPDLRSSPELLQLGLNISL